MTDSEKTKQDAEAQLLKLDLKLGKGVGAVKERAKLQAIIDNPGGGSPRKKVAKQKKTITGRTQGVPSAQRIGKTRMQEDAELAGRIMKALKGTR